jgi:hypothetical protein
VLAADPNFELTDKMPISLSYFEVAKRQMCFCSLTPPATGAASSLLIALTSAPLSARR